MSLEILTTRNDDEVAAAEIDEHAARVNWLGVRPDTQQTAQFRHTPEVAVVQRRGGVWFSFGKAGTFGPAPTRMEAARLAIGEDAK